jgi:integrase
MGKIIQFAVVTGLRASEVIEAARLLNSSGSDPHRKYYYSSDTDPYREYYSCVQDPGREKLRSGSGTGEYYYYNPERQALEHFRFPEIFIRQTKKAYISFITLDMLPSRIHDARIPSRIAITKACQRRHIKMDLHLCRKIFASWLRKEGVQPEIVDLLQGRVSQSILTRHYLAPSSDYKQQVLNALEKLQQQL